MEHSVEALIKQRVLALCLGYEDLNDHDELCRDRLLALLCGRDDRTGEFRRLESDRGKPLAGKSTLNRLERTPLEGPEEPYKKTVAGAAKGQESRHSSQYTLGSLNRRWGRPCDSRPHAR